MTAFDGDINRAVAAPPLDDLGSDLAGSEPDIDPERLWMDSPTRRGRPLIDAAAPEPHGPIPSVAAIAGHPLHPSVIPLPIGAFVGAFASDLAYAATHDRFWARASQTLLGAGIVAGLFAGALGALDFLGRDRIRDHGMSWAHAGGNLAAILLGALSLSARRRDGDDAIVPSGLAATTMIALTLGVTGWLGGEMSYRHKIGVAEDS